MGFELVLVTSVGIYDSNAEMIQELGRPLGQGGRAEGYKSKAFRALPSVGLALE